MKAVVYENSEVKIEESSRPEKKKGFAVVKVKRCGICGSDLPRVFNGKSYFYPIVLGHEFSGVVEDSFDESLIGKNVCVIPLLPCKECDYCKKEEYANCVHYDYYGSRREGGMQDYLLCKEENLIVLPNNVGLDVGAMTEPCAVTLHAVKKVEVKDKNIVIFGAGTIGILLAMWAKHFGAKEVFFSEPNKEKTEFYKKLGFLSHNGEKGEVVFDASGAPSAILNALDVIDEKGSLVLVGNLFAPITFDLKDYSKILRKQIKIFGSWNSDFGSKKNDWKDCIKHFSNGDIHPELCITNRFPLDRADEAFKYIGEKKFYNKIMIEM